MGGDGLACGLQVEEMAMNRCLQLIEGLVDGLLLLGATEGSMVCGIPAFRQDALGGAEVNLLLVYG